MQNSRPININPLTIRLPITAITSICHRISGVVMFLSVPLMLQALSMVLSDAAQFTALADWISAPLGKVVTGLIMSAITFHVLAGLRHLAMDMHVADDYRGARATAAVTWVLWAGLTVFWFAKLGGAL